MLSANFKPKTTAAASRSSLATARLSCYIGLAPIRHMTSYGRRHIYRLTSVTPKCIHSVTQSVKCICVGLFPPRTTDTPHVTYIDVQTRHAVYMTTPRTANDPTEYAAIYCHQRTDGFNPRYINSVRNEPLPMHTTNSTGKTIGQNLHTTRTL